MASYTLKLTPALINMASEGSMDTSVSGGVSKQRTGYIDVYNEGDRKIVEVRDGVAFNDTMATLADFDFIV